LPVAKTRQRRKIEEDRQDARDGADAVPDPAGSASLLIALQQQAGNAATSKMLANARMVQRQEPAHDTPTADPATAMTRIAWQTGVIARERSAAQKLQRPGVRAPQMNDAGMELVAAHDAVEQIGDQLGATDPNKKVRTNVHANAIAASVDEIRAITEHMTPHDIGAEILEGTIPSAESALADITAATPPAGGGGSAPASGSMDAGAGGS
jgi:hypothetical protein